MMRKRYGMLLVLLAVVAGAQDGTIRLRAGERVEIFIPDALMAFSRNWSSARILVEDGSVYLAARRPVQTQIVVLTPTQVLTFNLVITEKAQEQTDGSRVDDSPIKDNRPVSSAVVKQEKQIEIIGTTKPGQPWDLHSPSTTSSQSRSSLGSSAVQSVTSIEGKTVALQEIQVESLMGEGNTAAEVRQGKTIQLQIPGATAALAIDSDLLDASADHGVVAISGRSPGKAEVLIITPEGVKKIYILVSPAPPTYPPGFVPPAYAANPNDSGSYEFRYSSDRMQLQNRFDFTTSRPGLVTQIHFVNVDYVNGISGNSNNNLPSGFLRMAGAGWNVTLLDKNVNNSPLTVDGATIRGLHLDVGPWTVHAGYSQLATFYDFLVPTEREEVFGLSHDLKLSANSQLIQNIYYFPTTAQATTAGRAGAVTSLEYRLRRPHGLELLAELGFSRGVGAAAEFQWSSPKDFLHGTFHEKPRDFASLSINNLPGSVAEFSWNRTITPKLLSYLNLAENRLLLSGGQQTNLTSTAELQYKLGHHWQLSSGAAYSDFTQLSTQSSYSYHSLSLPEQINFDQHHFGAGFQYQFSKVSASLSPGQDLRGNVRLGWKRSQLSAFVERQTEALTVSALFSQIPSLQLELQRLGITAVDPSQLMGLMQDNAFLVALGLSQQPTLNLLPVRIQTGASYAWTSRKAHPQRLNLDFVHNNDQALQGTSSNWIQSGNYTLPLSASNELTVSYSWLRYGGPSQTQSSPQIQIGIVHNFFSLPTFLESGSHGTLTGVVYVDEKKDGLYDPKMTTVADVEVTLDGWKSVRTNERGRYIFLRVPRGQHVLEAHFTSDRPFWFTTASVVSASINHPVDFGITFAATELIGYVRNDARLGVPNVEIEIKGPAGSLAVHTDADGRFTASSLNPGDYELVVDPNSVPSGYNLEDLRPVQRRLEVGLPENVDFRVHAIRTVSGQVTYYDPKVGKVVALAGATIEIPELSRQVTTDQRGRFILSELPSGRYTLIMSGHMGHPMSVTRAIEISSGPIELQEDFRIDASDTP